MNRHLLVEGKDDQHVVWALCKKYQMPETFKVIDTEGINKLLDGIPERIKEGKLDALGIVLDADANLQSRWQSVKNMIEPFGYQLPKSPESPGTIRQHPDTATIYPLKVSVWLMPNNQTAGILEDFMQFLTWQDSLFWNLTLEAVEKVEQTIEDSLRFGQKDRSKALIHTYLAWQKDPGKPMGEAITKKYFDANAELAKLFVKWLNDLFNDDQSHLQIPNQPFNFNL